MPCEWTEKDIREARTIVALRRAGFSAQGIRKAQDYLRSLGFNPFSRGQVAVILGSKGKPQDLIKIVDEKTAFQLLRERGQLVMLSLAGLEADETGRTEVSKASRRKVKSNTSEQPCDPGDLLDSDNHWSYTVNRGRTRKKRS